MRRDKHLAPTLSLTERQTFFLNCWFNLVHQASVDSYRVRVMNPENILRELLKMYEPQADENDRRRVADEALEIFAGDPILQKSSYSALNDLITLLQQAMKSSPERKAQTGDAAPTDKQKTQGFIKNSLLIQSFARELIVTLHSNYLSDCFDWLDCTLTQHDPALNSNLLNNLYENIERVCRNLLSVALDDGSSLESLFQHYRGLMKVSEPTTDEAKRAITQQPPIAAQQAAVASVEPYDFMDRFRKLRMHLTAPPKSNQLLFVLDGVARPERFPAKIGILNFSSAPPEVFTATDQRQSSFLRRSKSRLFVTATIDGRDGRAAGMFLYRQIGEILDLVRFEYDKSSVRLSLHFLLADGDRVFMFRIPQTVPNPENELPPFNLEEFVEHLNGLVSRETMHSEAKDRVFSAFRLYRVGADADIFENKLINWWSALEYLAKGSKAGGGSIGGSVEAALVPTLSLAYLPKHLAVYKAMFKAIEATITPQAGDPVRLETLSNSQLFLVLKDPANKDHLKALCAQEPYLWYHLQHFIEAISSPANLMTLLTSHERHLRWQIQRIYRARCDIVHSGQQVVNASLLCANLEYYLKVTLDSMLLSFHQVTSLQGPHEFFERTRHKFERITQQLSQKSPLDSLLIHSLD